MKKTLYILLLTLVATLGAKAQGWPMKYEGVMLQGFYWDSYSQTQWTNLQSQADELSEFFKLVWIPQSANCGGQSMGYDDLYWFSNYNSSFGNENELRSMISTFKQKGIGTIADVVINHRKNVSNWVDFPAETYKGTTYQLQSTDICADDDGGETKKWATQNGYQLSQNKDDGEGWGGMRDLDHNSQNVQKNVLAYLDFLLNDLGYTGVRYDMTKGYAGKWTGLYNSTAKPTYSVGEYWDGNATALKSWLESTKVGDQIQSAAFDFPTRYIARDVFNGNAWSKIANSGLAKMNGMGRYAITFCENHDTEYRSAQAPQDPITKNIAAANAYILLINGTPCVFLKHWIDYKDEIKQLIYARQVAGITNDGSRYIAAATNSNYSAIRTTDNNHCDVITAFGSGYSAPAGFTQIISGTNYQVYMSNTAEQPWISIPSGEHEGTLYPTLSAISADASAKLVYTTDGTTPTTSSKQVASGTKVTLSAPCTLKVGLLSGGTVKSIQTRQYTAKQTFDGYDINVYVNVDKVGWSRVNFWTWGGDGSHSPKNTAWPGDAVTQKTTINGKTWYYQTYRISSASDCVNFVWSTASGSPQTVDVSNIKQTSYFEISTEKEGAKFKVTDVTETTSIPTIQNDKYRIQDAYNLSGQRVEKDYRGIIIKNGKKILK
ncbi:MAG: alpha-amylase family glycosyl hydrolase [Bacteroidaceae bacterium]|nr:alpha-amylase family glycosyl hydrolase [Bacteroidaceae bacterium]